jgi:hypothetical protein
MKNKQAQAATAEVGEGRELAKGGLDHGIGHLTLMRPPAN